MIGNNYNEAGVNPNSVIKRNKPMNIQAEKLELVRLILETDNPSILASVKRVFAKSKKVDFWDNLPQQQKDDIVMGIEEIDAGETVNYEEFIKKHR